MSAERPGGQSREAATDPAGGPGPSSESGADAHVLLSRFLQATVDAARDGVLAVAPDRRVLAVNRQFLDLWHLAPGSVQVGQRSPALGRDQLDQIVDPQAFEAAIRWGHAHPGQDQVLDVPLLDGRIIEGYAAPIVDDQGAYLGRVWYVHDETEQRRKEAHQEALLVRLEQAERAQRFLLEAFDALAGASGYSDALASLARVAVPTLGDLCVIDVLEEGGNIVRAAVSHADPALAEVAAHLADWPPERGSEHPSAVAIRERQTRWAGELPEGLLRSATISPEHRRLIGALHYSGYIAVPLLAEDRALGALVVVATDAGRRYRLEDVALAEDLARRTALVVAKERRYDLERSSSHALQLSLLSTPPLAPTGVQVAVRYLPGTGDAEVGGDFWDLTPLPSGEIGIVVGDVAGHDLIAAATMAQLRSACRALRPLSSGPAELVDSVQGAWADLRLDRVATALFARLDPGTGRLRLATAGHLPPVIVEGGAAWYPEVDPGPPLGAPAPPAVAWEGVLGPGASLILFTDGLVEDRHRDLTDGMDRLLVAASSGPASDAEAMADHVLAALATPDRADDVAVVVVRRTDG